jgi:hypothetical protein
MRVSPPPGDSSAVLTIRHLNLSSACSRRRGAGTALGSVDRRRASSWSTVAFAAPRSIQLRYRRLIAVASASASLRDRGSVRSLLRCSPIGSRYAASAGDRRVREGHHRRGLQAIREPTARSSPAWTPCGPMTRWWSRRSTGRGARSGTCSTRGRPADDQLGRPHRRHIRQYGRGRTVNTPPALSSSTARPGALA